MATCTECKKRFDDDLESCPDDGSALLPDDMVAAADATLPPGTKLGEYVIEAKIGEGAYGAVYSAEHPVIGKRAAIKVLNKKYASDLGIVSRFVTEARAVNRIRHPNIVDIFAIGQHGEQHFLAMELLEGLPLEKHLKQRGPLPFPEALAILRGVAEALDAAHQNGIVHRDLKPDNVFLVREGARSGGGLRPKLLDFGVAKLHGDGDLMHKTATGIAIGTPFYMSPEQCRGKKVDFASDIYSLGAMTYQMLTGVPPFDGESVMDILMKHMNEDPEPMSKHRPELGGLLDAAVATMLAKKPRARPASAGAAIDLLASAAATAPAPTLMELASKLPTATATTVAARTPTSLPAATSAVPLGDRPTVRPLGPSAPHLDVPSPGVEPIAPASTSAAAAVAASPASSSGMTPKASTLGPMSSASHAGPTAPSPWKWMRVGVGLGIAVAGTIAFLVLRTPVASTTSSSPSMERTSAPTPAAAPPATDSPPPQATPPTVSPTIEAANPEPSSQVAAPPRSGAPHAAPAKPGGRLPSAPSKPAAPVAPSAKPPAPGAKPGNGILDNRD